MLDYKCLDSNDMKTLLLGPWPYPENNWQRAGQPAMIMVR